MRRSVGLGIYLLYARLVRGLFSGSGQKLLTQARPDGALVWVHIVSAEETSAVLEVMQRFLAENAGWNCLVTAGSAATLAEVERRAGAGMVTARLPREIRSEVFLDHWKPDMLVWTEGGYRPALLAGAKARDIPMVMINARMSPGSFRRWKFLHGLIASVLGRFGWILAQDTTTEGNMRALGVDRDRIEVTGALREGSAPLPHNEDERRAMAEAMGGRPVWLAALTHAGEEEILLEVFRTVRRSFPELLMILVPNNPARGDELATLVQAAGWSLAQRSEGSRIDARVDVFLADTHGEMGLWYRLAPVSFLGGSLVDYGGHNPYEPTALGSAILHGPYVAGYATAYRVLGEAGACVAVQDGAALAQALKQALVPDRAAELATAAWTVGSEGAEVTDRVLEVLQHFKPEGGA